MLTLCWAAKGGSGASVVATALALTSSAPTLLVDLVGDAPTLFGLGEPDTPGFFDWMSSDAPTERLQALETSVSATTSMLHRGAVTSVPLPRWQQATDVWSTDSRHIIVDAGTRPPARLFDRGLTNLLVTRRCYLSVRAAHGSGVTPTKIVVINEPGRALSVGDIEHSLGAPVVAVIEWEPAIARAADAGLLAARLPGGLRRELRHAA